MIKNVGAGAVESFGMLGLSVTGLSFLVNLGTGTSYSTVSIQILNVMKAVWAFGSTLLALIFCVAGMPWRKAIFAVPPAPTFAVGPPVGTSNATNSTMFRPLIAFFNT